VDNGKKWVRTNELCESDRDESDDEVDKNGKKWVRADESYASDEE